MSLERRVTNKDTAARLGISHSTVSRALSPTSAHLVNRKAIGGIEYARWKVRPHSCNIRVTAV